MRGSSAFSRIRQKTASYFELFLKYRSERDLNTEKPFPYATCNASCPECDRANHESCSNSKTCECTHLKAFPPSRHDPAVPMAATELRRRQRRPVSHVRKSVKSALQYELPFVLGTVSNLTGDVSKRKAPGLSSQPRTIRRVLILVAEF